MKMYEERLLVIASNDKKHYKNGLTTNSKWKILKLFCVIMMIFDNQSVKRMQTAADVSAV